MAEAPDDLREELRTLRDAVQGLAKVLRLMVDQPTGHLRLAEPELRTAERLLTQLGDGKAPL